MSQPVNLRNEIYDKLKFFKEKRKHRSFSSAVDELLVSYWSPVMGEVQIQEKFAELRTFLQSRNLLDENTDAAIQIAQARAFQFKKNQANLQKKSGGVEHY